MKHLLVLGAGQLARMMALAGAPLGIKVRAYDVRTHTCIHPLTSEIYPDTLANAIEAADVITAEFEHISPEILNLCAKTKPLYPNAKAILTGGDRRIEKALLEKVQIKSAPYSLISSLSDLKQAVLEQGLPLVLKTALDGYDGKGQWILRQEKEIESLWQTLAAFLALEPYDKNQGFLAETFIPFTKEVSLVGVRHKNGDIYCYPLTENIHKDGILRVSLATNANSLLQAQAEQCFKAITQELDYVGILAIEFFEIDGKLVVNELAPRVHNSGHWTQNGASICQFEHHLRAIFALPLGQTSNAKASAMINIIGEVSVPDNVLNYGHCHWYDKAPRPGRKIGHINLSANSTPELIEQLAALKMLLTEDDFPCLENTISRLQTKA